MRRLDARDRIAGLIAHMESGLIERRLAVRLALLAALAGEHVVLIGPPGTAKSEICRRLASVCSDARVFERLMTRFSVPEELFGPLSLSALERDEYVRLTDGYLPTAHVAFLDEIFKANSAILNALLTILNEREFDNGVRRIKVPLISVVAAANEVPTEGELMALYDRFIVRCRVDPVSADSFSELLRITAPASNRASHPLTLDELATIRTQAASLPLSGGVVHLITQLREWLREHGIYVSDRRWIRIAGILKVAAFTEGRKMVLWADCLLLPALLWAQPEQEDTISEWLNDHIVDLVAKEPRRYERMVASYERFLDDPRAARVQARDGLGRRLFRGVDGQPTRDEVAFIPKTGTDGEPLFLAPGSRDAEQGPGYTAAQIFRRFFAEDVDGFDAYISDPAHQLHQKVELEPLMATAPGEGFEERARQVVELASDLAEFIAAIRQEITGPEHSLWVAPDKARLVREAMAESEAAVLGVFERVQQVGSRLAARGRTR